MAYRRYDDPDHWYTSPGLHLLLEFIHIDGLVQDCSNSIANAVELLQLCTKPPISCSNVFGAQPSKWQIEQYP